MKRTEADWLLIFDDYNTSGLAIAAYCAIHGISAGAFYNARSRYGLTNVELEVTEEMEGQVVQEKGPNLASETPIFIPVEIDSGSYRSTPTTQSHASPGHEDDISLICYGVPLILPSRISDRNLCRIIKACGRLC